MAAMRQMTDATLIVVNYNKAPYTRACLESVLAAEPVPTQIVAIDNGSTDGTREYLEECFPELAEKQGVSFELITNPENIGACTARNQGLERAEGRYIAFLDNDVLVRTQRWLAGLIETLEMSEDVGIVGPKLVYPFPPYRIQEAGVAFSPNGRVRYLGRGEPRDSADFNVRREVQALISACWVMKRMVPDQIGGLDEVFNPAQFEDFDFCYRARSRGWKVLYEPAVEMYHFESVTTDGSPDVNYRYITVKNGMEFKRRWQAMLREEKGATESECQWVKLETRPIEQTGIPPMID